MKKVDQILDEAFTDLTMEKFVRALEAAKPNPADQEELGFTSRPFVMSAFPARSVKETTWIRKNGNSSLTITVPEGSKIPYGIDRLIPIFLATKAVQTRQRTISFDSAAEVLKLFGLPTDGVSYKRLTEALDRVFKASVFFKVENEKFSQQARFHFISELALWKKPSPADQQRFPEFRNKITLSHDFFQEILRHPIPLDLAVVKKLRNNPLALDVYMFLAYRSFSITRPTTIPIRALQEAFSSTAAETNSRVFKARLKKAIERVSNLSGVKVTIGADAITLQQQRKALGGTK